eukprot:992401-Amphidinium_carterae.2
MDCPKVLAQTARELWLGWSRMKSDNFAVTPPVRSSRRKLGCPYKRYWVSTVRLKDIKSMHGLSTLT